MDKKVYQDNYGKRVESETRGVKVYNSVEDYYKSVKKDTTKKK